MEENPSSPNKPTIQIPVEDDSLDSLDNTQASVQTEKAQEVNQPSVYKLDTGKYLRQSLTILIVLSILLFAGAIVFINQSN